MQHRRTALAAVAVVLLGAAGCGDDEPAAPPAAAPPAAPVPSAPAPPSAPAASAPAAQQVPADPHAGEPGTEFGVPVKPRRPGTPAKRPRPAPADALTGAGYGPYRVGVTQAELAAAKLLGPVKTGAAGCATAVGVAKYHSPALTFAGGRLQAVGVTSTKVVSDQGLRVGGAASQLRGAYPGGRQLDTWTGASGWFVPAGGTALLFRVGGGKVTRIDAGLEQPLQFKFTDNQGC